jgi:hypothetical protein
MGSRARHYFNVRLYIANQVRIAYRRAKVVADFVSQRQLRDLGRYATVVVNKRDYASVETTLCRLVNTGHSFCVSLVLFANSTRST